MTPIKRHNVIPTRKAATNAIEQENGQEDHLVEESPEAGRPGYTSQFKERK